MVVDDPHKFRLFQTRDGLSHLVMVHQNDALPVGTQQVIPAQCTHHKVVLVQDGVTAVAALDHSVTDIVQIIVQMERDDIV